MSTNTLTERPRTAASQIRRMSSREMSRPGTAQGPHDGRDSHGVKGGVHPNQNLRRNSSQADLHVPKRRSSRSLEVNHSRSMDSIISSVRSTRISRANSTSTVDTQATSVLPPLQHKAGDDADGLEPLAEEEYDPQSFDLLAPPDKEVKQYALETRSEQLFSTEHLRIIFDDPALLLKFTSFLSQHRPQSIPLLIYYLDAMKALKAITYANAISEALEPVRGLGFTTERAASTANVVLEEKARKAFEALARDDLPQYITQTYIQTVSVSITRRITGTLPPHLRDASEGLAEVFCLTDPSRPDNPIVFASEEFHRTTQYGMDYVIGRNCRFLQGPKTNPFSVRRIREKIEAGEAHSEVFLNYRRDGSPFMNLLMCAPLCDSRGKVRYFIGAQVDVSGLVKECSDLESLRRLVQQAEYGESKPEKKDEFQELSEMLNLQELDVVRRWGGRMHQESQEEVGETAGGPANWNKPRLLIHDLNAIPKAVGGRERGHLGGIYEQYLLVRPFPSLHILFASPSLRVPGILQSPFLSKIGGSPRVREELTQAFADGQSVTAKVRWVTRHNPQGRNRWIHCTPLLGNNGAIGVWMVVLVDDEADNGSSPFRFREAPPVDPRYGREMAFRDISGNEYAFLAGPPPAGNGSIRAPSPASTRGAQSSYSL